MPSSARRPFGPDILDCSCVGKWLAVELDGGQPLTQAGLGADAKRTGYVERRGVRVLRFSNLEILTERKGVLAAILEAWEAQPVPALPSP